MIVNYVSFIKKLLIITLFTSVLIPVVELFKIIDNPIYHLTFFKDILAILLVCLLAAYFLIFIVRARLNKVLVFQSIIFIYVACYNFLNGVFNGNATKFIFNEFRLQLIYLSFLFLVPTFLLGLNDKIYEAKLSKSYIKAIYLTAIIGIIEFVVLARFNFYSIIHTAIVESGKGLFDNRVFSTFLNPNNFSQALLAAILFYFSVYKDDVLVRRNYILLITLILALLLTQSKTALLNFIFILVFFFLTKLINLKFSRSKVLRTLFIVILPTIIGLTVFIFFNIEYFTYRLNGNILHSLELRFLIWRDLFSGFNMLTGKGMGFNYQSQRSITIDSGIIKIFIEGGFLNLIAYLSFYSLPLINRKWNRYHLYYFFALIIFFLSNITIPAIWIYPLALHFNFILGFFVYKIISKKQKIFQIT